MKMNTNHTPFFCMKCHDNILLETSQVQEEKDDRGKSMQTGLCPSCQGKVYRFKDAKDRKSVKERLTNIDESVGDNTLIDFDGLHADIKAGMKLDGKLFMKHTLFRPGSKTCMKMSVPAFEQVLQETIVNHPDLSDIDIMNLAKQVFKDDHPQAFSKCIVPKYGDVNPESVIPSDMDASHKSKPITEPAVQTEERVAHELAVATGVIPPDGEDEDECCTGVGYKALIQIVGKEKGPEREKSFAKEVRGLKEDEVLGLVLEEVGEERLEHWLEVIEGNLDG